MISGVQFLSFLSFVSHFLFFLYLINNTIQPAATAKQQIQTTGLTAIRAIHIVRNHNVNVRANETRLVLNPIILDKNGNTFVNVVMISNIIENPKYISNNQTNLSTHVKILFACCACKNIFSALTCQSSNNAIVLSFDVV
jgi:hypothetical protein